MAYNYYEAMKADINEALTDNEYFYSGMTREELEEHADDDFWMNDSVTGNASGSYTFNRYKAKEYVLDNIELAAEAFREFDQAAEFGEKIINEEYEYIDVTIRCYLLSSVLSAVLDEAEESGYFNEE